MRGYVAIPAALTALLLSVTLCSSYELTYEEYVLVFEEYNLDVSIDGSGTAHVDLKAVVRNNAKHPLVPGYLTLIAIGYEHDKILVFNDPFSEGRQVPLNITNLRTYVEEEEMPSEAVSAPEMGITAVTLQGLWEPIAQGEKRTVRMTFDVPNAVDGFLFKEGRIPMGRISAGRSAYPLPVDSQVIKLTAPGPVTYADSKAEVTGNVIVWRSSDTMSSSKDVYEFEYTVLPAFPRLGFRGYWLFWTVLFSIVILALFLIFRVRGRLARAAAEESKGKPGPSKKRPSKKRK